MKIRVFLLAAAFACVGLVHGSAHADPAAAARYYEDGLARFQKNDIAGAIIQLRNALQQDRGMLAAQLLLAQAYLREGDYGPAEVAFEEALRMGVDRSEVVLPLGQLYLARGKSEELLERIQPEGLPDRIRFEVLSMRGVARAALRQFEQAEESFALSRRLAPDSALPLVQEVPSLLAAGRIDVAETRARRAVELEPDNPQSWNVFASIAHARGLLSEALAHYARALELEPDFVDVRVARAGIFIDLERPKDALADLGHLEQAGVDDPRAAYLRALLAQRDGHQALAADKLTQASALVDSLPMEFVAGREQLLMVGALSHHALGQHARARSYLDVLVNRYPRNQGARRLLASLLVDAGDVGPARSLLEGVLRVQPNDPQSHLLMGRVLLAQGRTPQALRHFEQAATMAGESDARMQAALGAGLVAAGERDRAIESLERAVAAGGGDASLVSTLVTLHMRAGSTARARELALELTNRQSGSADAHNLLGVVEGARGKLEAAGAAYRRALASNPDFHAARLNLARVDAATGRRDEARRSLETLVARNRKDHVAMYELGLLEMADGRTAEGVTWLEKAFAEFPPTARAGVALVEALMAVGERSRAVDTARAVTARHPEDLDALAMLVRAQLVAGNRSGALQTLRDMSRRAEFDPVMQVRVGYLQFEAGGADEAAYSAYKALTARPQDVSALVLATEAALAMGNAERANEPLEILGRLDPVPPAHARLAGELAMLRGDLEQAERHFTDAFAAEPGAGLLMRRVQVLVGMNAPSRAIELVAGWLDRHPADTRARAMLAELHMFVQHWEQARAEYLKLVEAGAANATVYNNLANAQHELGDPAALDSARAAFALDAANPFVIDTLGWLLVQAGQIEEGLRYLRDARLRAPEVPDIRYHLAYTLAELGLADEARRELAQALASEVRFMRRDAAEALARQLRSTE